MAAMKAMKKTTEAMKATKGMKAMKQATKQKAMKAMKKTTEAMKSMKKTAKVMNAENRGHIERWINVNCKGCPELLIQTWLDKEHGTIEYKVFKL